MIEVVSFRDGLRHDTAEAETPEAALVAARTLMDDFLGAGGHRSEFTVGFYVDAGLVRLLTAQQLVPLAPCDPCASRTRR